LGMQADNNTILDLKLSGGPFPGAAVLWHGRVEDRGWHCISTANRCFTPSGA
jgi:hypothetical protein